MRPTNYSLSILILLIFLNFLSFSQDTIITNVSAGIKHYSIRNHSVPWYIQVLEIDLTIPQNKITTALARDRLGTGFEKTSEISIRKSVNGNIVIGAINGDFYGISAPNNPYGFLANSQIINSEFIFGRSHIRSSFGVSNNKKPVVQVINFSSTITAKNSQTRNINECNSQRVTDALILYNRYFGNTTRTNSFGTEVEIKPIDSIITNSNLRFVVTEKQIGIGNMIIQPDRYILSGHGASKTYLDQNVFAGDTVILKLGTSPAIADLTALIGGGPRLLINGSKPQTYVGFEGFGSDFVNTRHPRTAVGFNLDSTKVFFVVVDGRQSNLSVGMTIDELADLMLSIGAYNAVNLDGGGSSTMVIHNNVVNSPSDPGGERSVANALLVVSESFVSPPSLPILLQPENGAINQRDTITLKWSKSLDASVYDLQVSLTPDFSSGIIVNRSIIIDTSFKLTGLNGIQRYYWRVRAKNILGTTSFTQTYNFTTGFPKIPNLLLPPHAATNVTIAPLLVWQRDSVATAYNVQLAHGSTIIPSNIILDTMVITDTTLQLNNLQNNKLYYWRVRAINQYGTSNWSNVFGFKTEPLANIELNNSYLDVFELQQNYPNPFNPKTTINFALSDNSYVRLKIYNLLGELVKTLIDKPMNIGYHQTEFDASDLPGGIYLYKLQAGNKTLSKKMILIK